MNTNIAIGFVDSIKSCLVWVIVRIIFTAQELHESESEATIDNTTEVLGLMVFINNWLEEWAEPWWLTL